VLDEVRVRQDVEQAAGRGLAEPGEVRAPDLVGGLGPGPDVVAVVVERAIPEEVDGAEHVVPRAVLQEPGHAVLAARDEVGLDAQAQVRLLADEAAVGVQVVAGALAPQLVVPHVERCVKR
jgi:hypothetical protein